MNPASSETPPAREAHHVAGSWSRGRWWSLVGLVFIVHLAFLFVFGERPKASASAAVPPTRLRLSGERNELLAMQNPTLFALPNAQGVAGQTWLKPHIEPFVPFRWTEAPRLLSPALADLGASLGRFMETNAFAPLTMESKPEPAALDVLGAITIAPPVTNSRVRLGRDLAERRWLNQPALQSWTSTNLLANTVVQVLVNQGGRVISETLLGSAGQKETDDYALQLVRTARFETRPAATGLVFGTLTFDWHVEPPAAAP